MSSSTIGTRIDRANIEAIYPLSPMQESLLLSTLGGGRYDPGFLQLQCAIDGSVDPDLLREAWRLVVARQAALRTSVYWREVDRPLQVVVRQVDLPWKVEDLRSLGPDARERHLLAFLEQDRHEGIDLSTQPTSRVALFRIAEGEWALVWSCHHVLLDGWSGALVLGEVAEAYEALRTGSELRLPPPRSYRDYIGWLQRHDAAESEVFWRGMLSGMRRPTPLPFDRVGRSRRTDPVGHAIMHAALDRAATTALKGSARELGLTLNTMVVGAWALLFRTHSDERDICFGTTVSGRSAPVPGIEAMVGLFINAVPVRLPVDLETSVGAFLTALRQRLGAIQCHEHTPLSNIQKWSEIGGGRRVFESLLVFENFATQAMNTGPARAISFRDLRGGITSAYPLTVVVVPGDTLELKLLYDPERFDETDAGTLLGEYMRLLRQLATGTDEMLANLVRGAPEESPIRPTGAVELPTRTAIDRVREGGASARDAEIEEVDQGLPPARELIPPRDAIELQLAQIFESVLGLDRVSVDDDFFELGGNSFGAARFFEQVDRILGKPLPLSTLFEARSVEQLARRLRDEGWEPPWSSLVTMQPEGTKTPLFLTHSYHGHLLIYRDLARNLAPDRPVFGLQVIGLDGKEKPLDRVEAMAERYVQEIRRARPSGPYLIAGYCFGVVVAYEMAQQLSRAGEQVAALIMLDSAFWTMRPRLPQPPPTFLGRVRGHTRGLVKQSRLAIEHLQMTPRERHQKEVYQATQRAWRGYRPDPYPGRISLFLSADYGVKEEWLKDSLNALTDGRLDTYIVPGAHITFMNRVHAPALADHIRACLEQAEA